MQRAIRSLMFDLRVGDTEAMLIEPCWSVWNRKSSRGGLYPPIRAAGRAPDVRRGLVVSSSRFGEELLNTLAKGMTCGLPPKQHRYRRCDAHRWKYWSRCAARKSYRTRCGHVGMAATTWP
jgi:hypothetical protein